MIVDTMTFPEIGEYLWKNVFTQESRNRACNHTRRNDKKYYLEFKKWKKNLSGVEKYKIFKPVITKNGHSEDTITVFYTNDFSHHLDYVIFTKFMYRGRKYVAMKSDCENSVMLFTWHSLQRYSERFLGDPDPKIDDVFIGDMLIFNSHFAAHEYTYNEKNTLAIVTTDGIFLGEFHEPCFVARTFISQAEYHECQREIDSLAIEILRDVKMELYGDTVDRED